MVTAIIISVAIITVITLLCFKGIKIEFNKSFTINDNRKVHTPQEIKELEEKLNPVNVKGKEQNDQGIKAPMDVVLQTISEVFGPDENDNRRDK